MVSINEMDVPNISQEHFEIRDYDFDKDLIERVKQSQEPGLNVYQPFETSVVLGRGSDPNKEINYTACHADGTPVYKRPGGGCAVVLDAGNTVVSVVLPIEGFSNNQLYFNRLSEWLICRLDEIGICGVESNGISDFVYGGKKVGGSCIQRTKDYLYYTTTLLVEPQFEMYDRYLSHPPREPEYRKGRAHSDFIGALPVDSCIDLVKALKTKLYEKTIIEELKQIMRELIA